MKKEKMHRKNEKKKEKLQYTKNTPTHLELIIWLLRSVLARFVIGSFSGADLGTFSDWVTPPANQQWVWNLLKTRRFVLKETTGPNEKSDYDISKDWTLETTKDHPFGKEGIVEYINR